MESLPSNLRSTLFANCLRTLVFCGVSFQTREIVNRFASNVNSLGSTVLDNKLPDEEPSIMSTKNSQMKLQRSSPGLLRGSFTVGEGVSFDLPGVEELFKYPKDGMKEAVDIQVGLISTDIVL